MGSRGQESLLCPLGKSFYFSYYCWTTCPGCPPLSNCQLPPDTPPLLQMQDGWGSVVSTNTPSGDKPLLTPNARQSWVPFSLATTSLATTPPSHQTWDWGGSLSLVTTPPLLQTWDGVGSIFSGDNPLPHSKCEMESKGGQELCSMTRGGGGSPKSP